MVSEWQSYDGELICEIVLCDEKIKHIWTRCPKCKEWNEFKRKSVNHVWISLKEKEN